MAQIPLAMCHKCATGPPLRGSHPGRDEPVPTLSTSTNTGEPHRARTDDRRIHDPPCTMWHKGAARPCPGRFQGGLPQASEQRKHQVGQLGLEPSTDGL